MRGICRLSYKQFAIAESRLTLHVLPVMGLPGLYRPAALYECGHETECP